MVGMEQLEVHSKSYLVRWISVSAGNTISWSIQPHKKSLNFGVFKHPGGSAGLPTPSPPSAPTFEPPPTPTLNGEVKQKGKSAGASRNDNSTVVQTLESIGMKSVAWTGKCEADKVTMGSYDVVEGEGGMYGLVFDNTFSKQVSKTVTFVLMTYPTDTPPKSGHHLHSSQATGGLNSSALDPATASDGQSECKQEGSSTKSVLADPRPRSGHAAETKGCGGSTFYTGILNKKRRKHNNYARRFFSLDFTSSTLSYYRSRDSSALRGSIPLSLAAVSMDAKRREISIDSGAEIWHLRTSNQKDFLGWRDALDRASRVASSNLSPINITRSGSSSAPQFTPNPAEDREWGRAEALVGKVSGIRDAVRRLAQDTDPKYAPSSSALGLNNTNTNGSQSPSEASLEFFKEEDKGEGKRPFWKRKPSSNNTSPAGVFRRSVSAQLAVPMPGGFPTGSTSALSIPKTRQTPYGQARKENGMHGHCMALLQDLDQVVAEFARLISESKARRAPPASPRTRRSSGASVSSDEFYDAEDGNLSRSQLLKIRNDSEDADERDEVSDVESESSIESDGIGSYNRKTREGQEPLFPTQAKNLTPLPIDPVPRRNNVAAAKVPPPSLISFLRKNVGKDLSTIAMPVSANEPTSLLQRVAETLEYSELLDSAAVSQDPTTRLLHITAFAISGFSNSRVKERATRKPFNPMLGETFELIREDKGFRYIAEKVSHRPVRMACQAEAAEWTFLQAPLPVQKFWGKSAELNTEGRARVFLHAMNESYSWTLATSFLRNVIAGEKYIEPVSTMTILNESTGAKAVVTFKAGGMFAGRSEEVTVQAFDEHGSSLPSGLAGKWTSHLNLTHQGADSGTTVWSVSTLVDKPAQHYGFTTFAASLNEITTIEEGKLPPTDSRLRPDQRAAENGDIDRAEGLKAKLEERQRARRKVMEEHGKEWEPKWFFKAGVEGDEEIWRLKGGKDSYWEERTKGHWTGVVNVFEE
ncbi:hypothetical protein EJ08DRAFT_286630 [Tothia fuscella]|uniref:PH domain-containing protein n=1 Tax=Tothia fuscella TaxID=1048955 RepID=A0A9P4U3A7_9PEZI|nr:hypothetical protein EJ08DRAFT_286630 [Tothia fuscella]